ncbi:E1A-binding protein p400-like isoform X2 [Caloenas nicobarica]|uniref:E1A-binding protein p400-like isoform X2 n=1 Tax=Caloenas nicobarica TaxID=187106 RepID=UPI0032B853FA
MVVPSLFHRVTPRILKTRQKSQAQRSLLWVKQKMDFARPLSAPIRSAADTAQDSPAWLIAEDSALLKALEQFRTLALNLAVVSPAHTLNREFVSDAVNSCNHAYRSPKQCQNHYIKAFESMEGKNTDGYHLHARQACAKEQNSERAQIYMNRFELTTATARKRSSSDRHRKFQEPRPECQSTVPSLAEVSSV